MNYIKKSIALVKAITPTDDTAESNAEWDKLYTYLFDNFNTPENYELDEITDKCEEYIEEVRGMLDMDVDALYDAIIKYPPVFTKCLLPVCFARYLLKGRVLNIRYRETTTFHTLYVRYGKLVLGA